MNSFLNSVGGLSGTSNLGGALTWTGLAPALAAALDLPAIAASGLKSLAKGLFQFAVDMGKPPSATPPELRFEEPVLYLLSIYSSFSSLSSSLSSLAS